MTTLVTLNRMEMNDWKLTTPVAFIIFNRPDTTERVFEVIRQAKPPMLLVVADGPRQNRPGEAERCAATRDIIERVDWDCKVLKNYSDVNMGCGLRPATGISWVFEHVEEAIILEDDCLPDLTFFRFCEELLNHYRHDTRVMHIAGNRAGAFNTSHSESYSFSIRTPIWGWATWKRAWRYYDFDIKAWPELKNEDRLIKVFGSRAEYQVRSKSWDEVYESKIKDAWDYQWMLACLCQGHYSIIPKVNLISNLGFNQDATHTLDPDSHLANLKTYKMEFPLVHPKFFIRDYSADNLHFKQLHNSGFANSLIRKAKKTLRALQALKNNFIQQEI